MKFLLSTMSLLVAITAGWGLPVVDGAVTAGEYDHQLSVISDTATVSWSSDGTGGFSWRSRLRRRAGLASVWGRQS